MKSLFKLTLQVEGWTPNIVTEYCQESTEDKAIKCVLNSLIYRNKTRVIKIESTVF